TDGAVGRAGARDVEEEMILEARRRRTVRTPPACSKLARILMHSEGVRTALPAHSKLRPHRLGLLLRRVIKNPIAVIAGDDLLAAAHVGHYLWAQRHVAGHAGAVAFLLHCYAIPDA